MTKEIKKIPYIAKLKKISNPALYGALGAAAMLAPANIAIAQSADVVEENTLEEIVVTGIRGSLISSLNTKRNSDAIVDAITAEDIGKFPDKNLAEAIQRVPGVVINREFGEGERVSIRGTSPNLTRTQLNGHSLATADWFILDQLNATRSFNYLILPSDIVQQVKVYKSPQANIEEGGVGGLVDVITRKPFDQEAGSGALSVQYAYSELSDETDPNISGLYSWKNDDSTFGVLVSGTRQERNIRRDGIETLGYFENAAAAGDAQIPSLIGAALFTQERIRTTGNIALQWAPNDRVEVNLNGLYSEFEAQNTNSNFIAWGVRAIGNGGTLSNAVIQDGTVVAGTIASLNNGTQDFGAVYDVIQRDAVAETTNVDLDVDVEFTDNLSGSFRIGTTDAIGNTNDQPFIEFGAPASFDFDLRSGTPVVNYNNINPNDLNDLRPIFASLHEVLNDDSEDYAYVDFSFDLGGDSIFKTIELGAKYTAHERELRFNATTYGGFFVPINSSPSSVFASDSTTPGDFLNGITDSGITSYFTIDEGRTRDFLFNNLANATAAGNGRIPYPQQQLRVEEDVFGGYVMANIETDKWRGNVGVRVVKTETTSEGAQLSPTGSVANLFGAFDPLSVESDYTDVLPSLNLTYSINDNTLARFSAAKVITRPDFTDITPRSSLNPGALSGTSGNPDIDPFEANQFDATIEYYPTEDSTFAAAVFYKDVTSFVTNELSNQTLQLSAQSSPNAACTAAGAPNLFNCPFAINQRANGQGGSVFGVELAAVVPLANGFGLQANYTYVDSEDDETGLPLPGTSEDSFNGSFFYEGERFSAKLAYNYRSDFFITIDRSTPLSQEAVGFVEASISYNITDNLTATIEGVNLTDETIRQFGANETQHRATYKNGRVIYAGLSYSF